MAYFKFLIVSLFLACVEQARAELSSTEHSVLRRGNVKRFVLYGDFNSQVLRILNNQLLTRGEFKAVHRDLAETEHVLQKRWPGAKLVPFGSLLMGVGSKHSDIDALVVLPDGVNETSNVLAAKAVLEQHPDLFRWVRAKEVARVPTVTAELVKSHREIELSFNGSSSVAGTRLVSYLLHLDTKLLKLAVVLKFWAAKQHLLGNNNVPGYVFTLMTIFFLQEKHKLPSVYELQKDMDPVITDHWNVAFNETYEYTPSHTKLFKLLCDFFEFYANFDFENKLISSFVGRPLYRTRFENGNPPKAFELYKSNVANGLTGPLPLNATIIVQEPFDHNRNVASCIGDALASKLKAAFVRANEIVQENHDPDTLLLELLTKSKSQPDV